MWREFIQPNKLSGKVQEQLDTLDSLIEFTPTDPNPLHNAIHIHEWVGRGVLEGILFIEEYMAIGAELRQKGSNRLH